METVLCLGNQAFISLGKGENLMQIYGPSIWFNNCHYLFCSGRFVHHNTELLFWCFISALYLHNIFTIPNITLWFLNLTILHFQKIGVCSVKNVSFSGIILLNSLMKKMVIFLLSRRITVNGLVMKQYKKLCFFPLQ